MGVYFVALLRTKRKFRIIYTLKLEVMTEIVERLRKQKRPKYFLPSSSTKRLFGQVDKLARQGKLFNSDGTVFTSSELAKLLSRAYDAFGRDLRKHIGIARDVKLVAKGNVSGNVSGSPSSSAGQVIGYLKVEIGGGWCAVGAIRDSACFYDGIMRCDEAARLGY